MSAVRKLKLNLDNCIGCQACTHVCPADLISFHDGFAERTLQYSKTCAEDCTRCADACSEKAIALQPVDKAIQGYARAAFPLKRCMGCGTSFATEKMVEKIHTIIPHLLVSDDRDWINTCLRCRQTGEAKQIARRALMGRLF